MPRHRLSPNFFGKTYTQGVNRDEIKSKLVGKLDDIFELVSDQSGLVYAYNDSTVYIIGDEKHASKDGAWEREILLKASELGVDSATFTKLRVAKKGRILLEISSSDGDKLVLGKITKHKTFEQLSTFDLDNDNDPIDALTLHESENKILIGSRSGNIQYWDADTMQSTDLQIFDRLEDSYSTGISTLRFLDQGEILVGRRYENKLVKLHLDKGDFVIDWHFKSPGYYQILDDNCLLVFPKTILMKTGITNPDYDGYDETEPRDMPGLVLIDRRTGRIKKTIELDHEASAMCQVDKSKILICDSTYIRLFDVIKESNDWVRRIPSKMHLNSPNAINLISEDSAIVFDDFGVSLWNVKSNEDPIQISRATSPFSSQAIDRKVTHMAVYPHGEILLLQENGFAYLQIPHRLNQYLTTVEAQAADPFANLQFDEDESLLSLHH